MGEQHRTVFLDLETTNLRLDAGHLLAVGWAINNGRVEVQAGSSWQDRQLTEAAYRVVSDADVVVTYYGKGFDWKALQTRAAVAGLPPLPPVGEGRTHIDLYWIARRNFSLHRYSLESVAEMLHCPYRKVHVSPAEWDRAAAGDTDALQKVAARCASDVRLTRWVYWKLRPYIRQHPRRTVKLAACQSCGSDKMTSRGYWTKADGKRYRRVQCQACGRWDSVKL